MAGIETLTMIKILKHVVSINILLPAAFTIACQAEAVASFRPGQVWLDTAGQPVQAHGGGILLHDNVYYWYGEDRTPDGSGVVACYSSTNLLDWTREGAALSRRDLPHVGGRRAFVERPKVIYNPATAKFVMWSHLEAGRYTYARAGIATCDSPTGKFTFLKGIRPITNDFNYAEDDPNEQKQYGGTYRDMNLFVDDDGRAYAFYSSEGNWTMYIVRLNGEFTGPEEPTIEGKTWARILVRQMREAPAPFKYKGKYYLVTSGCTGWKPNAAAYAVADDILGPWKSFDNPCVGPKAETTFDSQSTFVLPVPDKPGKFIFMADRWKPENLSDSRYVWLPLTVGPSDKVTIEWRAEWKLADLED